MMQWSGAGRSGRIPGAPRGARRTREAIGNAILHVDQKVRSTVAALQTSYEREGYDGVRKGSQWWFESWGTGPRNEWTRRQDVGRPPKPSELRTAEYIVVGIRHRNGEVIYRTHVGGLDFDARIARRDPPLPNNFAFSDRLEARRRANRRRK